jgi:hypothetical protein
MQHSWTFFEILRSIDVIGGAALGLLFIHYALFLRRKPVIEKIREKHHLSPAAAESCAKSVSNVFAVSAVLVLAGSVFVLLGFPRTYFAIAFSCAIFLITMGARWIMKRYRDGAA